MQSYRCNYFTRQSVVRVIRILLIFGIVGITFYYILGIHLLSSLLLVHKSIPSQKKILLWTKWNGDAHWNEIITTNHNSNSFQVTLPGHENAFTCIITSDRSHLDDASAVIFHGAEIKFDDLPKQRYPWQRWVFFLLETPVNTYFINWKKINEQLQVNWTMTYNYDLADVVYPYGAIKKRSNLQEKERNAIAKKIDGFVASFPKRRIDALWIVSNCMRLVIN